MVNILDSFRHALGLIRIDDTVDAKVRAKIITAIKALDLKGIPKLRAENLIEETACHAIAQAFAETYPGKEFKVTQSWPRARVIISGNIAVIAPWLGHDHIGDEEGFPAINVEVQRQAMILDARPKIRRAIQGSEIPNGQPDAKQNARK